MTGHASLVNSSKKDGEETDVAKVEWLNDYLRKLEKVEKVEKVMQMDVHSGS